VFRKLTLSIWVVIFLLSYPLFSITLTPVANVSLTGGQYYLKDEGSTGGNLDLFCSPVLNFSKTSALLPIVILNYRGTKDVTDLVGGGTLVQQTIDAGLSLKYVQKFSSGLKIKPRIGYYVEYLKETNDEEWGKGLFDYNKIIAGFEVEKQLNSGLNLRAGLDYYTIRYPNYISLLYSEKFETSIDTVTYSELSANAGKNVLDYNTSALFVEVTKKMSEICSTQAKLDFLLKNFTDAKTVDETGTFTSNLRQDIIYFLTLGANFTFERTIVGLTNLFEFYDSNQNSFDTANAVYIENYYDFWENSLNPSLTFLLGEVDKITKLTLYYNIGYRQYISRLAQKDDSSYLDEKTYQKIITLGISLKIPVVSSLSCVVQTNYRDSSSNMRYEKNYKYNYTVFNYFVGVNWQY